MSILTERVNPSDLDKCAELAIDSIISMIASDTEMTGDELSDSDSSNNSMTSPASAGNLYGTMLPLAPITMHPTAINRVILTFKTGVEMLTQFLTANFESKNLVEFWLACEALSKSKKEDYRKHVKAVYSGFIRSNAMQRVILSKKSIEAIKNALNHNGSLRPAMETAQDESFNILQQEAFPQFKASSHYQSLLRNQIFLNLCSVPPPPPSSVCSSCVSTQSSVHTKLSNGSSTSTGSDKSNRHDVTHKDRQFLAFYSRTKKYPECNQPSSLANRLITEIDREIQNRNRLTTEIQDSLRMEGSSEEEISNSDWTSHTISMKYIELNLDPEESNPNISEVISCTTQSIDTQSIFSPPNEAELKAAIRCDPALDQLQSTIQQFRVDQPANQMRSNLRSVPKSSASDILPRSDIQFENIQIRKFFQGLEAHENQSSRNKNAYDAALQIIQNANIQKTDEDTTINWAERKNQRRHRRHSFHRSTNHRSCMSDTGSMDCDSVSVASLPLRNSAKPYYHPNRHAGSDAMDSVSHYGTLPRKGSAQYTELQVFYRVGENSERNLFTRVQQPSLSPFTLKDFIHKVFKRIGQFRYYFNSWSQDLNEFVWEEIILEDFPVPLCNGRIMALIVPQSSS